MAKKQFNLLFVFDMKHMTALHWASKMGHASLALALCQLGADTEQLDKEGKTALYHALEMHNFDVANVLLHQQASPWSLKSSFKCSDGTILNMKAYDDLFEPELKEMHVLLRLSRQISMIIEFTPFEFKKKRFEKERKRIVDIFYSFSSDQYMNL